jgi:hypothetical protein
MSLCFFQFSFQAQIGIGMLLTQSTSGLSVAAQQIKSEILKLAPIDIEARARVECKEREKKSERER